ncbi:MAG: hypothetical protein FLDDKLPJ_01746 [Phycisphaerae bacterium]|nr:hypothetical protein [Phycisphaerae bacterium]
MNDGKPVTIGAGSIMTRDAPPRVAAAGHPRRVIRRLHAEAPNPAGNL